MAIFFSCRPFTMEDMLKKQQEARYHWDNRDAIREIIMSSRVCLKSDVKQCDITDQRQESYEDSSSDVTVRDSGSSVDSVSPMFDDVKPAQILLGRVSKNHRKVL